MQIVSRSEPLDGFVDLVLSPYDILRQEGITVIKRLLERSETGLLDFTSLPGSFSCMLDPKMTQALDSLSPQRKAAVMQLLKA